MRYPVVVTTCKRHADAKCHYRKRKQKKKNSLKFSDIIIIFLGWLAMYIYLYTIMYISLYPVSSSLMDSIYSCKQSRQRFYILFSLHPYNITTNIFRRKKKKDLYIVNNKIYNGVYKNDWTCSPTLIFMFIYIYVCIWILFV